VVSEPTLWLSQDAIDEIVDEAQKMLPNETGGILLGWEHHDRCEIVIVSIIGPGAGAVHAPTAFRPDASWQDQQLAEIYERSGRRVTYLGDWHVHPLGGGALSRRDRRTLHRIATSSEARAPRPLMGILSLVPEPSFSLWRWQPHLRLQKIVIGWPKRLAWRVWRPSQAEVIW
jgi:integrative and conjugative element protein (TIGR02256 family)